MRVPAGACSAGWQGQADGDAVVPGLRSGGELAESGASGDVPGVERGAEFVNAGELRVPVRATALFPLEKPITLLPSAVPWLLWLVP
jgi:hypothetical protein